MLYRVKQFIWALTSIFKKTDYKYINKYLYNNEIKVFNSMKKSDIQHCVRVAKTIEKSLEECNDKFYSDDKKKEMIRLGLLHDIGKSEYKLNCIEKSIIVILDKITKSKIIKYKQFKIVRNYYYHAEEGSYILKNLNNQYSDEFLYLVENHHDKNCKNDLMDILRNADDNS